jgi:hypothetical protein
VDGPLGATGPDAITDHSFTNLKTIADALAGAQAAAGLDPIGLDSQYPGLHNLTREGDSSADMLRQPIDFYSPDTFNYTILEVGAGCPTLTVTTYGINSYAVNTFPELSAAGPVRQILSFQIDADTTPPVIQLTGDNPQTVECHTSYTELGATASDNCAGDLTKSIVIDASAVNVNALGSYLVSYTVTDAFNNTTTVTRTVQVVDTTPPVFGSIPDVFATATSVLGANVTLPSPPPSATDTCEGLLPGTYTPASGSLFAPGKTAVDVSAEDSSGNIGHGSFNVFVTFAWSGFLSPFPKAIYKMGSTIPIKFMLTGASAGIVNLVATASWAPLVGGVPGPYTTIGTFTFNQALGIYQVNWKTTSPAGNYRIKADFGDGSVRTVDVVLK